MSQELIKVRAGLSKVSSDLKREQYISAATAVREGARLFGRVAMMKSEQDEIADMLRSAADAMRYHSGLSKIFPLAIEYKPGEEQQLMLVMEDLIGVLEASNVDDAKAKHKAHQEAQLDKGKKELERGEYDDARKTLGQLGQDYSEEVELTISIAEAFMASGLFEDAVKYMQLASRLVPESVHVLNRLGIAHRRLKQFEQAEEVYERALTLDKDDPNLYFNMGRVYLDWGRWDKAIECGKKAVELAPHFSEAAKLVSYATKQMQ